MKRLLLAAFILSMVIGVSSCSGERSIIIGHISGLEKGDVVYLASGNILQTSELVKSVTVRTDGEFEAKITLSDTYVTIYVGKDGRKFNPKSQNNYGFFLEGFSTIELIGEASKLDYLQISGGLYSLPEMTELNTARENALSTQKEGLELFNYIQTLKKANKTPKDGENKDHTAKSINELQEEAMSLLKMSNSVFSSQDTLNTIFILNNPDLAYSAELLLYSSDIREDIFLYEKTFLDFSLDVQNTNAGRLIAQQISAINQTKAGNTAPDFMALDMNGNSITLSGFKGKYVLLEFWASWCRTYKNIAPQLVSLYSKYGGPDFQIIGVATEEHSVDNLKNVILQEKLNWIQINDTNVPDQDKVQNIYAVMEVPYCFFIDPEGKIIAKGQHNDVIPVIEDTLSK